MMWVIRGTDQRNGTDFAMVVEARSHAAAELWALKRGVPADFVGEANKSEVESARRAKQLWRTTPPPRYTVLGNPVSVRQLVCLMLVGVFTAALIFVRTSHHRPNPMRLVRSNLIKLTSAWT
jgi:hypothetical protein